MWGRGNCALPSIPIMLLFLGKSFSESQCLASSFGGLSCGFSPWAVMLAHASAVGFPHVFSSPFSHQLTNKLVLTACCVPCCLLGTRRDRRDGKRAKATLLPPFHILNSQFFGVWHLRASLTSSCPAQLGQLYRASFSVTLLVLLLYLPFIDNQLLDNEQVLVHLKDCLMGGGMVERKVHGI